MKKAAPLAPLVTIFHRIDGPRSLFSPAVTTSPASQPFAQALGEKITIWLDCDTGGIDTLQYWQRYISVRAE